MITKDYTEAYAICEQLLERGYGEYEPSRFDKGVERVFQKHFDDDYGKRYYLDIKMYAQYADPYGLEESGPVFDVFAQMYRKDTHNAVNLSCLRDWSIVDAEAFFEELFESGMFVHCDNCEYIE